MWDVIIWIIIGGLAGWVASIIMKTNKDQGVLGNIILGVIGGLVGGFIFSLIGSTGFTGFNIWSFFVALVGAVIVIAIKKAITKK